MGAPKGFHSEKGRMEHKPHHNEMNPSASKAWRPRQEEVLMKAKAAIRMAKKPLDQIALMALEGRGEHHQSEFKNGATNVREMRPTARGRKQRQLDECSEEDNCEDSLWSVWRRIKWPRPGPIVRLSRHP